MKHKLIYIVLIIVLVCGISTAQTVSKNLSLADYVSYQTLYNGQSIDSTVFTIADIASWEDSRYNKEYALICLEHSGSGSGVAMVEVTDPSNAVYKKTIRHPNGNDANAPFDVKVYNDILFVAQNDQSSHPTYWVELEDAVDNLGSATAGVHTGDLTAGTRIHNLFINKDHELLFLSNFFPEKAIMIYDISGLPGSSPAFVDSIEMEQNNVGMRSHDLYAMETSTGYGRVFDANLVSVTVTDYSWNGSTFSVTGQLSHEFHPRRGQNPDNFSNPFTNEHQRSIHSTWVGQDTDYLFTTVEGPSGDNSYPNTWVDPNNEDYQRANYLSVWDINPINPSADGNGYRYPIAKVYEVRENASSGSTASSYFSTLSSEKANSIHNITTRGDAYGDTAFISYYTKGIRALDVTNPSSVSEIAYYDVPGFVTYWKPVYNGTFGVDPFLPSGIILGSSSEGLYVFRSPGVFAGNIDVNTIWTGTIKIVDNVTISSGVTLTIDPGATIQFSSGTSLTVNGTLNANGQASNKVTFDRISSPVTWAGIKFNNGSSGRLEHCIIKNVSTSGGAAITINGSSPVIENCTIENNTNSHGIYVTGNGTAKIYSSTIRNNDLHGIYIYNGNAWIRYNTITGSTATGKGAVYCYYYSTPLFAVPNTGYEDGYNTLQSGYYGLYGNYNCLINAGQSNIAYGNSFLNNSSANVYAATSTTIYAQYDYWCPHPSIRATSDGTSTIYTNPNYDGCSQLAIYDGSTFSKLTSTDLLDYARE